MATRQMARAAAEIDTMPQAIAALADRAQRVLHYVADNGLMDELPGGDADPVAGGGSQTKAELVRQVALARALLKLTQGVEDFDGLAVGAAITPAQFGPTLRQLAL